MLLIYTEEGGWSALSDDDRGRMMKDYGDFTDELRSAGAMVAGDALQPTTNATTVRVRDDEQVVTDGPFAETKEQLGGYTIVEAKDLDEVLAVVARHPLVRAGFSIEVRPIRAGPPR